MKAMNSMTESTILLDAKAQQKELSEAVTAVTAAKQQALQKRQEYVGALRSKLVGKIIEVTGYTESEELYLNGGVESDYRRSPLNSSRVYVTHVFIVPGRYSTVETPVVHATYEEAHLKRRPAGGLSFRLLEMTELTVVDPATSDDGA